MINLGTAVGTLALDGSKFNATLEAAYESVAGLDTRFNALSGGLGVIGKGLTAVGKGLTATVTTPVIGFGAASIKAGADFDAAMAKVMAIGGDFGELQDKNSSRLKRAAEEAGLQYEDMGSYAESAFNLVRQKAIQMGNDTKFTAEESASALYYMALAGWGGVDMLEGLEGIMALSAASGVDLARTSDIVTDALTAFGKEANEAGRFADILAATSANSNTNVDLLGESFKYVAPVAGAYGYKLEDVALALGTMASAGVKGTQAGTGLRQALKQLTTPTDENAALMRKYGISLYNADGSVKSLRGSMEQWRETFGGINVELYDAEGNLKTGEQIMEEYGHSLPTTEMEKLNAVASIFGTRALPGVLAIINSSDEKFKELAADIDGSSESFGGLGDAAYQQHVMIDNLKGDWILFTSALGTAKIIISDMANGPLRSLVQGLKNLVTSFNTASPETQQFVVKMALMAASIGPAIFAIGKIVLLFSKFYANIQNIHAAITILQNGFTIFGGIIGGLSAPMLIIIGVIVSLIAAFVHLWRTNEDFRNRMILLWNNLVSSISYAVGNIKKRFDELMEVWGPGLKAFKKFVLDLLDTLQPIIEGVFGALVTTISAAFNLIADVMGLIVSLIRGDFAGAAQYTMNIWEGFWQFFQTIIDQLFGGFVQFISNLIDLLGPIFTQILEAAKQAFFSFVTFLGDKATELFNIVADAFKKVFNNISRFVKNVQYNVTKWLNNIITAIIKWATDFVSRGYKAGSDFLNKVSDFIGKLPGNIKKFLSDVISKVAEWAADFVNKGMKAGSDFVNKHKEKLAKLASGVKEKLDKAIERAAKFVSDFGEKATKAATDFYNNIVNGISSISDKVSSIGRDIVYGIWNGISGLGGWIWGKVKGFVSDKIIGGMKAGAETNSPSKAAEREVGRWLPPGIVNGFESTLPASMRQIENSLNDAITNYNGRIKSFVIGSTFMDPSIVSDGVSGQVMSELYWMLAQYIADALRTAPIVNNVNVEMEQGNVVMDRERVGRVLAPVVSRVIATGGG